MIIKWIECSDHMPPDDYECTVIAKADIHDGRPFLTDGGTINKSTSVCFSQWVPYTKDVWKELNK